MGVPKHEPSPVTPRRHRVSPRAVTGLVLAVLAVVLAVENRQLVDIRVFVPMVTMPLWTALAVLLIVGVVIGFLVARPRK
ncbi:LapA family protein [Saccharopolyspora sp. K220]|uniref:LapA family protein n=1 Tax=Saccharopolyspora soli TaxID=2926618 RepID=UPI001F58E1A6|nr:LapA family protein [Saccharopolyspora soli]MCI2417984.1 LapA family protein [Saccharopolyspora soli]